MPGGHWTVVTVIGAVRTSGPFAAATVVGATDSDVFRAYVREVLAPELRHGDVVVMDNLSPHKAPGVREAFGVALATVTPADRVGFFRHCGYAATSNRAQL